MTIGNTLAAAMLVVMAVALAGCTQDNIVYQSQLTAQKDDAYCQTQAPYLSDAYMACRSNLNLVHAMANQP